MHSLQRDIIRWESSTSCRMNKMNSSGKKTVNIAECWKEQCFSQNNRYILLHLWLHFETSWKEKKIYRKQEFCGKYAIKPTFDRMPPCRTNLYWTYFFLFICISGRFSVNLVKCAFYLITKSIDFPIRIDMWMTSKLFAFSFLENLEFKYNEGNYAGQIL